MTLSRQEFVKPFQRRATLARFKAWLLSCLTRQQPVEPPTPGVGLGRGRGKGLDQPKPVEGWSTGVPLGTVALAAFLLATPAQAGNYGDTFGGLGAVTGLRNGSDLAQQQLGGGGAGYFRSQAPGRPTYNDVLARTISDWMSPVRDWLHGPQVAVDYGYSSGYGIGYGPVNNGRPGGAVSQMDPESRGSGVSCC